MSPGPQVATQPNGREPSLSPREPTLPSLAETLADELDALFRFALCRLGGDRHAAEDAVQQTARIALDHASPPTIPDEQRAWLRGIAQNVVRRHWRSHARHDAALDAAAACRPTRGAAAILESGSLPARGCPERADLIDRVFRAVSSLHADEQRLFYDFYRAGRSHQTIARELGASTKAVEARLYRMRSRLRAALTSQAPHADSQPTDTPTHEQGREP